MAKEIKGKYFYHQRKLDLASGIVFFLCFLFIIMATLQDHNREWKQTQRDFRKQMEARIESQLQDAAVDPAQLEALDADIAAEEQETAKHQAQLDALDAQLANVHKSLEGSGLNLRNAKAELGAVQYEFELASHEKRPQAEKLGRDYAKKKEKVATLQESHGLLLKEQSDRIDERAVLVSRLETLRESRVRMFAERDRLNTLLARYASNASTAILNAPMLDFIQPTERIEQVVVQNVRENLNYTDVPVVDRCTTCHRVIERLGFENEEQPFRTHSRMDLFVGAQSPHPFETFGCTTCHGGRGRSLTFSGVAHTPDNEEQEADWQERYGWQEIHHFDNPMKPLSQIESSCLKCHKDVRHVPEAPLLNEGRNLFFSSGCFGCHETIGFEGLPKTGPELDNIASKADPLWLFNWILDPRAIRKTTNMPQFFGQSNQVSEARDHVEARAMVEYLQSKATPRRLANAPVGNPVKGQQLFETIGCRGCHVIGGDSATFGPDLEGIGRKTSRAWIYEWIRDPRQHSATTRMPNLRLTEPEAADIAAYLSTEVGNDVRFDQLPALDAATLDEVLLDFISARLPLSVARQEIAGLSIDEKLQGLGKRLVGHYGCFGCHKLQDFETTPRIGTSLTEEGSKPVSRLDFGLLGHDIGESRTAFFAAKLKNPRIYDKDRIRKPLERLRMPNFEFEEREIEALTVFLAALTDEEMPEPIRRLLSTDEVLVQRGEWMITAKNCRGCHRVDGEGGDILALYEDEALGPPILNNEGAKVQTVWLNNFLNHPSTLRPWLKIRMPSFSMSPADQRVIIDYFTAQARLRETAVPTFYDHELITMQTHLEGRQVFGSLQCKSCHPTGNDTPNSTPDNWGPDLALAQKRLRAEWIIEWLKSPQDLLAGTRMPSFFYDYDEDEDAFIPLMPDADEWMYNVRDYLMTMDRDKSVQ